MKRSVASLFVGLSSLLLLGVPGERTASADPSLWIPVGIYGSYGGVYGLSL